MIENQSQILKPVVEATSTIAIHKKNPVTIVPGNIKIYVIRIYNEGNIDGYADEITGHLPQELEFVNNDFSGKWMGIRCK